MEKEKKYFKIMTFAILMVCACFFTYPSTNSRYIKDGTFSYDTNFYQLYYDYSKVGGNLKLRKESSSPEKAHFRLTFLTNPSVKDAIEDVYSLATVPSSCEIEFIADSNFNPAIDYKNGSKTVGANLYCPVADLVQEDEETIKLDVSVKERIDEGEIFTYTNLSYTGKLSEYLNEVPEKVDEFDIAQGLTKKEFYETLKQKLILYAQSKDPKTELSIALKTYINNYLFTTIITNELLTDEIITKEMVEGEVKIPYLTVALESDVYHFEILAGFDSYAKSYKELSFDNHYIMTFEDIPLNEINVAFKYYLENFMNYTDLEASSIINYVNSFAGTSYNGIEGLASDEIAIIPGIIKQSNYLYSLRKDILDYINQIVVGNRLQINFKSDTDMVNDFEVNVKANFNDYITEAGIDDLIKNDLYVRFVLSLMKNATEGLQQPGSFIDYFPYYDVSLGHYVFFKIYSNVDEVPENKWNNVELSIYEISSDVKIQFTNYSDGKRLKIKITNDDRDKIIAAIKKLDAYFGVTTDISKLTITDTVSYIINKELESILPSVDGITSEYTNQDVNLTITDEKLIKVTVNGVEKVITNNNYTENFTVEGEYTVVATNENYSKTTSFTIDKTLPTITGVENNATTNAPATITYNDSNLAYITVNGTKKDATTSSITETYSEIGTYIITATDKAGNETTEIKFTITN